VLGILKDRGGSVHQPSRQERHGEIKAAILRAARAAILEQGPARFSLRDVARRSGYSPAGLYEYFSGKPDLVRAVADESLAQLHAYLSRAATDRSTAQRLVQLGLAYIRFARENPQHFMLIFTQLPSQRATLQVPPAGTSPYQLVIQAAQDGIDAGVFVARPGFGAEQIAYGLWAMAHGMAMLQQTHLQHFAADFEAHDWQVLEQFVAGLGPG
jgi:AcrR family transcriptional regulator